MKTYDILFLCDVMYARFRWDISVTAIPLNGRITCNILRGGEGEQCDRT